MRIGTLPRADDDSFSIERDWVLSHADLFPDGKAKKAKDNPELIHFMYLLGNGETGSAKDSSLSKEEITGQIPYLLQWDVRWGFHKYGDNNIGFSGCDPTCLAMILAAYIKDSTITPAYLADYAINNGYYEEGTGTRWAFMTEVPEILGVPVRQIYPSQILDEISGGHPVIASVGKGHLT